MPEKKVEVKVATDVELEKVRALEDTIRKLKQEKLELDIEARTEELEATEKRIESLKTFLDSVNGDSVNIPLNVTDDDIKKAEAELEQLESEKIDLEIAVESGKLDAAKSEIEALDDTTIDVDLNNQTALQAIDQISQGFDRLKTGVFELKDAFSTILSSAGSQEMNKTFLEMNLGAEGAKSALQDINSIVANLPGDDTALQGLLSQAAAKNAGITRQELEGMAVAATDYFSAMSFYGKSAAEAQQDMTNYILTGNTAELQMSPILRDHIDKLKEGTTIQERSQLLQEALNEAGWGGISQQDTYNNKLETFNGMLERGRYNLGGMFQEGAKGAMDFLIKLDEGTNGLVGMGIALAGFASPLTDSLMGLGQMATGIKAIKDLELISWLKNLIPVQIAEGTAGWFSIGWIAAAILLGIALGLAFIYLYENCDWFREAVNNLAQTLQWLVGVISSSVMGAVQWLINEFQHFTESLGLNANDWTQAILGFILFLPTLPNRVAVALLDAIASALGFGENFTSTMLNTAVNAVLGFITYVTTLPIRTSVMFNNMIARAISFAGSFVSNMVNAASRSVSNFMSYISTLPGRLLGELNRMLSYVSSWAATLPAKFWQAGVNAVKNFLSALGIASPGTMQRMMIWEVSEMARRVPIEGKELIASISSLGRSVVDEWNPSLGLDLSEVDTLGVNAPGTGAMAASTININLEVGTVDSSDRVQEIVDVIRRELNWNNITAGRTI